MAQTEPTRRLRWYQGLTGYHWSVLAIASAGWIFDVFEGQLFALMKSPAMKGVLGVGATPEQISYYASVALGFFLLGGAVGGLGFGILADRYGRRRVLTATILMYSVFSGLTFFAQTWWHLAVLRFLVAMGVGGEWAVAAAAVAEVFPDRSRPAASGIFHASSGLGTLLASLAAGTIGAMATPHAWRYTFLVGFAPALLVVWVRASMRESERWQQAKTSAAEGVKRKLGSFRDLFSTSEVARRTIAGTGLAIVGLATFWCTYAFGRELATSLLPKDMPSERVARLGAVAYAYMTIGGTIGLLAFAPFTYWTNRRVAFLIYHLGALIVIPLTCYAPANFTQMLVLMPFFGFFTVGMHAGYAIYFPELFPTRMRATGGGFCFNVARIIAGPVLFLRGYVSLHLSLEHTVMAFGMVFLIGLVFLAIAPETKGHPLPE